MIFVLAGTQDGRELAGYLLNRGERVLASVVSEYGERLLAQYAAYVQQGELSINDRPLDEAGLIECLATHSAVALVDASHPYAENASRNAMAACRALKLPYIRYERAAVPTDCRNIHPAKNYEDAARIASEHLETGSVFLTTGSRNLKAFVQSPHLAGKRIVARVLPTAKVLEECAALGFSPRDIIAMQGPFSQELNEAMFRQYQADVIVTKNSGRIGGADTKLAAAKALELPVVLIQRPGLDYPSVAQSFEEVLAFLQKIPRKEQ